MWFLKLTVLLIILKFGSFSGGLSDEFKLNVQHFARNVFVILNTTEGGISDQCRKDMYEYIDGLSNSENWAIKMYDATARLPVKLVPGVNVDLGFFDQCLSIDSSSSNTLSKKHETIFGKYCIGTLPVGNRSRQQLLLPPSTILPNLEFGICGPNTCSALDFQIIYANVCPNITFSEKTCQVKSGQYQLNFAGILTLWFMGVVFCIMFLSTVYDVSLLYSEKMTNHSWLTAFSVVRNGKQLLKISNSSDQISCLCGLRVISTIWIMLLHIFTLQLLYPIRNFETVVEGMQELKSMFITNASLSVDTFFVMSGLLVSYVYMNEVSKGIKFNIISFYRHRYIRLTPVLAVIALINLNLLNYIGSGPLYTTRSIPNLVDSCQRDWWKTLLYVQNYGNLDEFCVPHSWYLSVDSQLFFLSPIILISLKKWPKRTLVATKILTVCTMITSFVTGWIFELNINPASVIMGIPIENHLKWYYFTTYTRSGPWFIGIILGYYIFQTKQNKFRLKVNKCLNLVALLVSFAVLFACIFGGHNIIFGEYDKLASSFHLALVRPVWAVGVSWIIFTCVRGYGGPINRFLSLPIFQVMSKYTYTINLLHVEVMVSRISQMRAPLNFSIFTTLCTLCRDFAITFALATVFIFAFEFPMITIEQALFRRRKTKLK